MGERWRKIEGRWETEHKGRERDDDGITLAQFSPAGRASLTLATHFFDITFPFVVFVVPKPAWLRQQLVHMSPPKPRFLVQKQTPVRGNLAMGFCEPIS